MKNVLGFTTLFIKKLMMVKKGLLLLSIAALAACSGNRQTAAQNNGTIAAADSALFRLVQQQSFQYFWDGAEPVSGLGRGRFHVDGNYPDNDKNVMTSGGAGFWCNGHPGSH